MNTILLIAAAIAAVGAVEYFSHRYLLHRARKLKICKDHLQHHKNFTKTYEGPEHAEFYDAVWVRTTVGAIWSTLAMLPVFFFASQTFAIAFVIAATLHALVWAKVHKEIHRPTNVWWSRNKYFQWVRAFHRTHHRIPKCNFAFLFAPVYDIIFRTNKPATYTNENKT